VVDITHVCRNCKHGNNKKGKWIKKLLFNQFKEGTWNVFCERRFKYVKWDHHDECYTSNLFRDLEYGLADKQKMNGKLIEKGDGT